ncbi:MAG: beta-propeller fold lactonase family protein [Elusimicrobiota bacterium]
MTGQKRSLEVLLGGIIVLVILFALTRSGTQAFVPNPVSAFAESGYSNPSKYGILTSSRWAYGAKYKREDLKPVAPNNPHPEPQPHRDHPWYMAISPDGRKLYVSLAGNEVHPGSEVAVFDTAAKKVLKRIGVGSSPMHLAFHPGGRFLVVLNQFSNYASVVDTRTDTVVSEIPLDFYCQYIVFNRAGTRAFVSNRYLNQVLVVDVRAAGDSFKGGMLELGGYDDSSFTAEADGRSGVYGALNHSCGGTECHAAPKSGFYAGKDRLKTFFSAMNNSVPGDADDSVLLRAVRSVKEGGFADDRAGNNFHAEGRVIWSKGDSGYRAVAGWIDSAGSGPGIPVGNFGSKPRTLYLGSDEKYLFVGNLGTQDISIIDVEKLEEVSGIYTQNLVTDLTMHYDERTGRDLLIALSMGVGFGAAKERDPLGGETEDPNHAAAQFTVIRDTATTEPLPIEKQKVLGRFDAVDGTAGFKMTDIQNDIIVVDAGRLNIPPKPDRGRLRYALMANRYEAHWDWVRYTSDSAEILPQDISGDIPPELQRVVGSFPEGIAAQGDRLYVAMLGSYELVEYKIDPAPREASDVLEPVAVYKTGIMPRSVVVGPEGTSAEGKVFVSNFLGETVTVVDRRTGETEEHVVGDLARPVPDTNAERGEMFVMTNIFSADEDTSCQSCHIYGLSDARGWGAGQAIAQMRDGKFVNGGLLAIPQLRNLFATQPFYFEGTHTAFDAQFDDAREHVTLQAFLEPNPHGDFTGLFSPVPKSRRKKEHEEIQDKMSTASWGDLYDDLRERRDEHTRRRSMEYFGKAFNFRDFQRFIGEFQAAENRLMPNPFDPRNPSVARGKLLFNDLGVGCVICHKPPEFTDKAEILYHNNERVLPSIISFTRREKAFTLVGPHWMDSRNDHVRDLEYWETGRVERKEGSVTTFPLRGLFDRPSAFLHHGRAMSVLETFAAPSHYALRRYKYPALRGGELVREERRERGFNELSFLEERTFMMDTHGGTSHLNVVQARDLERFLLSIE